MHSTTCRCSDDLFAGPPFGTGILTAALILAVMIIPFIAATMRDVFETVPPVFKESAYGVGCTTWEVMRSIVIPYTRVSVVGGIMLGLGRALGETMAVTFVIGNTNRISTVAVRTRQHHRLARGAGVPGKPGRQPEAFLAAGARLHPVRDLLHRAGDLARAAAAEAEGMSADRRRPGASPGPARNAAVARALSRRRRRTNLVVEVLCVIATVIGLALLASILFTLLWRGFGGPVAVGVHHASTLPPGSHGGLLNAIIGSLIQTVLGAADRHADRADGRHLSRRVRAGFGDRQRRALRLRRAAVGAVDPDRPVRLSARGGAVRRLLRHRRLPGAGGDRHPDRRAHHRGHAAADPRRRCARRRSRWARRNGR